MCMCVCSTYHIPGSSVDRPSNSAVLALLFNRMLNISARACEMCRKRERETQLVCIIIYSGTTLSGQPPFKGTFICSNGVLITHVQLYKREVVGSNPT